MATTVLCGFAGRSAIRRFSETLMDIGLGGSSDERGMRQQDLMIETIMSSLKQSKS